MQRKAMEHQPLVIDTPINSKTEMSYISYNLRIMQEYFQPKIGTKIRIFSLGRKNNILIKKKSVIAKLIFVAFNRHAEIPANSNQPG